MPKLRPAGGFDVSVPVAATLVIAAVCLAASLLTVGVHTLIALRWPSFPLNVGIALGGLLCVVVVMDTRLRVYYPWSQAAAAQNVVIPWIFHWPGSAATPEQLLRRLPLTVADAALISPTAPTPTLPMTRSAPGR